MVAPPTNIDGLIFAEEEDPENYIDYKLRGENRAQHGELSWLIEPNEHFQRSKCFLPPSLPNPSIATSLICLFSFPYLPPSDPTAEVRFCFYSHANVLLARSPNLTVLNPDLLQDDVIVVQTPRTPTIRRSIHAIEEPFEIKVLGRFPSSPLLLFQICV